MTRSTGARIQQADGAGTVPDRRDPLRFLAREFDADADVWPSASGRLCVADPDAARAVLGNRDGAFVETSDFFHTRDGVFGPRAAQAEIGRSARALMHRHLEERRADLPRLVRRLAPESRWPDAANLLVREHLRDVLLGPDAPAELHDVVDAVITRAVLAGARERHSAVARLVFRRRTMRTLAREIERRGAALGGGPHEPRDLLDVAVVGAYIGARAAGSAGPPPRPDAAELAEVYLSFLFAAVGSTGFALAWSVYLAGTHPSADDEPAWIVREALRLWPVAWLFSRTAARTHKLAGQAVDAGDDVNVCLYLVHRHPHHWDRPDEFVPRRWAEPGPAPAFLPFGFGTHACAGATVVLALLEDLVRIITEEWRPSVSDVGDTVHLGPALAPPAFTLRLRPGAARGHPSAAPHGDERR
ncbi:cytochrome P450 [Yinghuangia seranimata]|uniref:cytochrome P450 n=1 Tax=Yinghuangia seranimata TaxID=408067 RepID=UPI00248AC499|nr:cytochrome P450 [Yinghuangia seranimata]MDI2130857.1 cytochrome P450 [Yinghuangia seranimata]